MGMVMQARAALDLPIVLGVGEQLPFADQTFDFLSMGYALRHLSDLRPAFAEFRRVLKPGGIVCLLEIARPGGAIQRKALEVYFKGIFPILSRLVSRRPQSGRLWTYYWETIDQCVPATTVLRAMSDAGLIHARRFAELGIFAEYTAVRPSA
jgi:demethylmenaquinone methyltransferase/2-methoxy-6-polyprenyl-1,4-benzoquinol methylase